ncbi:hypothetical protein [Actinoplanes aureus]|uniref:Uncharacterized protein n=1 Tax=Actinoplanes aureus TaxID=2792083 RepID=A0A931G4D4_9ACTN|nr:hypothetical protein [Actinoplanes aureus]MBG0565184.1 hypothetical protein [Actinoplanes aureus]
MAIAHIAVLSAALSALLILPCAAAALLSPETRHVRRLFTRRGRQELRALRTLDRTLRVLDPGPRLAALDDPAIEQIAFDLQRLDHQRRSGPTRCSAVWLAAVLRAYDARLQLACRRLGVTEHLQPLDGLDREIERVRVEGQLEAAGLTLRRPDDR